MDSLFRHRRNQDNTIDSICTICFLTAGHETSPALLHADEEAHQCPGPISPINPPPPLATAKPTSPALRQPRGGN